MKNKVVQMGETTNVAHLLFSTHHDNVLDLAARNASLQQQAIAQQAERFALAQKMVCS